MGCHEELYAALTFDFFAIEGHGKINRLGELKEEMD